MCVTDHAGDCSIYVMFFSMSGFLAGEKYA